MIIKAWISEDFQEELCRHTRRLQKRQTTLADSNHLGQRAPSTSPRAGSPVSSTSAAEQKLSRNEDTLVNLNQIGQRAPCKSPRTGSWESTASEDEHLSANSRPGSPELTNFNIERQLQIKQACSSITLTKSGDSPHSEVSETNSPPLRDFPGGYNVDHANDLPESEYDSGSDLMAGPISSNATRYKGFIKGKTSVFWNKYNGPTVEEVRDSAHRGCHLCTLILTTWLVGRSNKFLGRHISKSLAPVLGDHRFQYRRISLELRHRYLYG